MNFIGSCVALQVVSFMRVAVHKSETETETESRISPFVVVVVSPVHVDVLGNS